MEKQENKSKSKMERRTFFQRFGKGIIAAGILSLLPFRISKGEKKPKQNLKVKIHPNAVKRTK